MMMTRTCSRGGRGKVEKESNNFVLSVKQWAGGVRVFLKSVIAPSYCVSCRIFLPTHFICKPCLGLIKPVASISIQVTKKYKVPVHALSFYRDPLISLIWAKYYSHRLASVQLGRLMVERIPFAFMDFDYIVPVPLHWLGYARRWYNQTEVMAKEISHATGKQVLPLVKRSLYKRSQVSAGRDDRVENIAGVFELTEGALAYKGKKFLIVDDVMTTGATMKEVLYVLSKIAPEALHAVVVCRSQL